MNLLELQRRMAEDVMRPLTSDSTMQMRSADSSSMHERAESYIKPNDRLSSFERLEIYNRQYWLRAIGAVAGDYPGLNALLEDAEFESLVLAYLQENPSTSFTLRNLGSKLPQWLDAHPEIASKRHRLLVDVARLEWAYVESFDSASVRPLSEIEISELTAKSCLSLQPHLHLLDLSYPVDEYILAVHGEKHSGGMVSNAVSEMKRKDKAHLPRMRRSTVWLAVHRFENSVYYRRLDHEAFRLLAALQAGQALDSALQFAFSDTSFSPAKQARKIQEYFAHASELGWFCDGNEANRFQSSVWDQDTAI